MNIKRTEAQIRNIMRNENRLGQKYKGKKLPTYYYSILEDANFHSANNQLSKMGVFGRKEVHKYPGRETIYAPKAYGSSQKQYEQYKKKGGRTWNVFD